MRVLHIDSGKEMRGGQRQVLSLIEGLGNGSKLLAVDGAPLMRAARERGLDVEPLNLATIAAASRAADLIHAHCARSHTWAAALASCPVVVSRRVAFPVARSFVSRWKYARPAHYIAISEHVKSVLLSAGVPATKISVVYDGVRIPDPGPPGNLIVSLDTADPMKGKDLVMHAANLAGVEVHFTSDLPSALPRAALFLYITRSEGLGSAALLSMAAGVPVVASRVGGLPEIVIDGVTGMLTDNEPAAIARTIHSALANLSRLRENARPHVERRFSCARMVEDTVAVYGKVAGC